MPEQSTKIKPAHQYDKVANEKIVKLGKKITDVFSHKLGTVTVNDPEYWGLAEIVSDDMADVALTMKVRHHYTFEQLCKMNKEKAADKEKFQKLLDEMSYIGLLEYDYGNHYDHNGRTAPQSERRYTLPLFVPGSAELFNMEEMFVTPDGKEIENKRIKEHPAVASFFERMTYIPLDGITQLVPPGGAGVGMHVIPVEKAISMENKSVDIEHLSYWLKKYEGHIGVGQCSCRASRKALDEGCADDQYNWCIGVGDFADYSRETGKGHDITYEEAMRILKIAEDNGFVHQITNIDGENKIFGICNCNVNICNALRTSQLFNTPNMSRSAYTAHVDEAKCVACGKCVEYCPAGAAKLGQKLCKKDGSKVIYPKHELPDNMSWGKDKYDENYRDNNRINCYETGTAPCKTACPAHVAVQGYLKLAGEGKYKEALALIKKDNPLPAICGRICNKRCEEACTRGSIDKAVSIDAVKKFIAEQDLKAETRYIPEVVIASNRLDHWDEKIAIIGAGPAGLSCAYYLATKGYKPTIFEKNKKCGGMLTYGIPSYKLEKDVVEAEVDVIRQLGVEIKTGVEVGKDITLDELRAQGYKAFYIAIGCQGGKKPNVPGDDAKNTFIAVDFLHDAYEGKKKKLAGNVVVIGGGNVAIDCARVAARLGASSVSMFSLEKENEMPAAKDEVLEAKEEKVDIKNSWGPKEIKKDENGKVTSIIFKKCVSVFDEEHHFSPKYDENELLEVNADYVIYAIGQDVLWGNLLKGENVEMAKGNYPKADPITYQTTVEDIFIGGDLLTGPKFVIDAIATGHNAADSLNLFVRPQADLLKGRNRREFIAFDVDNVTLPTYDKTPHQEEGVDPNVEALSFKDKRLTFSEEQAKKEASRCLGCGLTIVDPNKCYGCGICTLRCKFDAIHLERDNPKASRMHSNEQKLKILLPIIIKRKMKFKKLAKKQAKEVKKAEK